MKNIRILSEKFHFLMVKFSVLMNRRVFVMCFVTVFPLLSFPWCLKKAVLRYCGISRIATLISIEGQ